MRDIDPSPAILARESQETIRKKLTVIDQRSTKIKAVIFIAHLNEIVSLNLYKGLHVEKVLKIAVYQIKCWRMCSIAPVRVKGVQIEKNIMPR